MTTVFLNPSDHASKNVIVCTRAGKVAWRGGAKDIAKVEDADKWHVHPDNVPALATALEKMRFHVQIMK